MPRKKRHKTICKLPQQDIINAPKAPEGHQWDAELPDLLAKIRRVRDTKNGAVLGTPAAIMHPPYTDLPGNLYRHLLRLIIWTHAIGTPGVIPTWAANHPAIRAKELTAHNLTKNRSGALHLTIYLNNTDQPDPATLAVHDARLKTYASRPYITSTTPDGRPPRELAAALVKNSGHINLTIYTEDGATTFTRAVTSAAALGYHPTELEESETTHENH